MEKKYKSFFILHGVMSKSITPPHIVICDLGTVLDLRLLHSFTYLENKMIAYTDNSRKLWSVYRLAL